MTYPRGCPRGFEQSTAPWKILIVEDTEMNRDMLSRRLARPGCEITMAMDGEEGTAAAKTQTSDLILMDMSLPVVDGWDATRRLPRPSIRSQIQRNAGITFAANSSRCVCAQRGGSPGGNVQE